MKFDIDSARRAGYSDDEIADYLASQSNFDLSGAIQSGYSARDVIDYLAGAAPAAAAPDTGDETARLAARYKAPEQPGIIQRVADYLKPAPKSVMEGYVPTLEERQADVDRRLSYGAGPVSSQTAAQADLVRSGMATTDSPVVKKVAKAMDAQGTKSFGDLVQGARRAEEAAAASEGRLPIAYETEFRAAPEPTIFDRVMDFFGPNRDAAAVELAARRIAEEQGISPEEVYKSVGGSRPIFNPEGRAPIRAGIEAAQIIASEIPKVPAGAANTVLRAIRGGEISTDPNSVLNLLVKATDGDKNAFADPNYQAFNGIGKSFGYSLTSMVATATAAAGATLVTGPAGGLAAGSAAGLTTTYRASKDEFLDRVKENLDAKSQKVFGRPMSEQEWSTAKSEFDSAAMRYGAWEAVPETISNLIFLKPFAAPLKAATSASKVSELANRAIKAAAIDHVPEHVTETLTALGQNRAEIEAGLTTNELTPTEAFKQQAVQTLLMSGGVAGSAKAVKSASDFYQQRVLSPDRQIARAMDQEIANTDFAVPASEVAADLLNPNTYDQLLISPAQTSRQSQTVNFTEPDSATAQAGLTPIVVPVPNQAEVPDVGAVDVAAGAAAGGGQLAGDLGGAGVGDAGLTRVDATGAAGGGAAGLVPVGGATAPVGGGAGQRAATVGLPRPLPRATDADLLARAEAAVAAQENNNADTSLQPWAGRAGNGYLTEQAAEQGRATASAVLDTKDTHDWRVERMESGRYQLVPYLKETSLGTQAPQAVQAETQGQEAAANAGGVAASRAAGAPTQLQGGRVPGLTLAPPASIRDFGIFQKAVAADGIEIAPVRVSEMNDTHKLASVVARLLGKTYTVARVTSGNPRMLSNGMVDKLGGKHIVAAENSEDAPLFVAMHEAYHGLPADKRKALNAQLLKLFRAENKDRFLTEFNYTEAQFEEEAPAFMAQVIAKRADFWEELRDKMGNKEFGEVAKIILGTLNSLLRKVTSQYGQDFADTYISDIVKARDLLTTAYAEAMREQGLTPDAEVTGGVMSSQRSVGAMELTGDLFKPQTDAERRNGFAIKLKNPVTLADGSRLSGFTDPVGKTTFYGYDKNGERFTVRRESVKAEDVVSSRDGNRTADAVRASLGGVMASQRGEDIGAKLQARVDNDFDALVREYNALKDTDGGRILDTDIARELSPEYRADRSRAAEIHEAASAFIQKLFETRMAAPHNGEAVVIMAGGGGSGKSSAKDVLGAEYASAGTVLDGTLSSLDKARRNIQRVLDSGRAVSVMYVYREPIEALRNGVLTRAMRGGRTVPIDALVKAHAGASDVMRQLAKDYAGSEDVAIRVIDNSRGPGGAVQSSLENITPVIKSGLKERFINATNEEFQNGRISETVYRATIGDAGAAAQVARETAADDAGARREAGQGRGSVGQRDAVTGPVSKDEAVVDGVVYSSKRRNLVDIPTIELKDLVGKKVVGIKADLTDAGRSYTGIDGSQLEFPVEMMGGPNYVRLPENAKANVVWAVRGGATLTKIMSQVEKSDYVLVHAMNGNSHLTNSTISTAYLQTVEAYLRDGRISRENLLALDEIVRSPKNKSGLPDFPGFESPEIYSYIDSLSFDQRGALAQILEKKEAQVHGLPNLERFRRETIDPDFAGYRQGDAMLVIKVDKENPTVKLGEEGTKLHPSYPLGLRGTVIGKLAKGVNYEMIFRDYFKFAVPNFKNGEAGAWYAFDRKMPIQKITQEIADSVAPGGYSAIKTARQAEAALQFANGNWLVSGKTKAQGGISVQEFVDALRANDGAAALTLYSADEVKAGIKDKSFTIYQLGKEGGDKGLQVFFGLKRGAPWYKDMIDGVTDNEVEVVSVTNNESGAPGIGIPAIITKAISEGATVLDAFAVKSARFPNGFLPEMYAQFGFEEIGRIPFDPSYYDANGLADLKAFWSRGGWREADGYPDVVVMRWKGNDEDRATAVERYVRSGATSVPGRGVVGTRAAAADARGKRDGARAGARGRRSADAGSAGGDQGAGDAASVVTRAYGSIQELATLGDGDIRNLGLDPAEVQRLRDGLAGVQRSNRSAELARGPGARPDGADRGKSVTGIHYGKAAGLSRLSGAAFGSGIKGAEQARLNEPGVDPRIKKRVYFYLTNNNADMPRPEIGLGAHVYRATLGNLYDPSKASPEAAKRVKDLMQGVGPNAFESAVLDAGYRGYVNREQGTAVVLNADVPVAYEGLAEAGRMRDRVIQRVQQGPVTRTEGDELVRKPTNDEMMGIIRARPALATAAPSFKLQFGDARVLASEAAEADRVLAEAGAAFQFGEVMRSNRVTDTPAFKRWFGDSKVVDENGEPLVVYHGTGSNISAFTPSNSGSLGEGIYFTDDAGAASRFAERKGGQMNVLPVYLKAESILDVDNMTSDQLAAIKSVIPRNAEELVKLGYPQDLARDSKEFIDRDLAKIQDAAGFNPKSLSLAVEGGPTSVLESIYKAAGFDAITRMSDGLVGQDSFREYLVFRPEQIKSAIGNEGTFDPTNPDIRRSNRTIKRQKLIGTNFTMESSSATDAARIKLQDDGLRMKRVIEAVKAKGGKVTEAQNFYDANTLMPGRIQAAIDDFKTDVVKPMLDKAAEYGIDMDELSMYAYAKHAKERNAYIASINKRMPDGGSGMTNDEADNILQMVDLAGDKAKFEDLHQRLMSVTSATRQIMLSEGLITQDEFNQLEGAYDNYIPLRGFENVDEETGVARPGIGRGINVRGAETVRALGRKSKAGDLIENVIRDYERVIMRVEKNDVGKVLLDFVLSNPDPDLWGVDVERTKAGFNKALGTVQYTKAVEKGDDTIGIKVGGQQVYIKLADKELARALRQAWKDETSGLERATLAMTGWWNNWMRAVLTKYNPAFAAINIPRDALWSGTAAALDDLGAKGLGLYLKNYGKALMASSRQELGVSGSTNPVFGNPQVDRMFQEFRAAGGITGGFYMRSLKDINQDLRNELLLAGASARNPWEAIKSLPPFKLAKLTLKMLEFMGVASENATRFALYMTSREMGNTPTKAALLAKDGTTNFNRKGEWGGALNNLYLFFNAAVQGNAQLVKVLKNRKVQAAMAGVSGVGMMLALYGATAGGEDDDGEKYWDKIPSYVKERNLVIMLSPGEPLVDGIERVGKRGRYITIPVQYGFNIFPNLGYMVADVLRNAEDKRRGVTPTKAALHMTSVVMGSINPFGGAVDLSDGIQVLLAVSPTLTDLPIELANERGTFGTPSAPPKSPWDKRPDSERMYVSQQDTVPARIAKALNELGGGNEGKAGSIMGVETSVTPGTIQTLISATTGGLGSFVEQIGSSVMAMSGDEKDLKANKVPFLNKFYGEVDESANIRSAAERMAEIRKLSDEVKAQQKAGIDPELKDDEQKLMALAGMQESYQRQQAMMRKAELEIIKDTKMTDAQKTLERRRLQVERDKLATEVNRAYLQATK